MIVLIGLIETVKFISTLMWKPFDFKHLSDLMINNRQERMNYKTNLKMIIVSYCICSCVQTYRELAMQSPTLGAFSHSCQDSKL